ncbi:T9SS type A sorting domain-containing protein [Bacteroidota bacterium]
MNRLTFLTVSVFICSSLLLGQTKMGSADFNQRGISSGYLNNPAHSRAEETPFSIGPKTVRIPKGSYQADTLGPVCTTAPLSIYGGWNLNSVEPTGFFHVKEVNGAWYLIDPLGNLFISIGVTSVEKGGGIDLPGDLETFYFNNLGMWSDVSIENIPISPRFNFLQGFKNTTTARKDLFNRNILPVFDSEFKSYCDTKAATFVAPYKTNPWVLGYYSDNELVFHKLRLEDYLGLPATDSNFATVHRWMINRKGEGYSVSEADRMEFKGFVASTYASAVKLGLKKHDPNHLYIGCRLHAAAKYDKYILRGIGEHVDVNSINFYARWEPSDSDMDLWLSEAGKPFLITEFYTKARDTGLPNASGAGWEVYTQQDRADFYENFTMRLLSHPGSVGWTWFRYIDKDEVNKGVISIDYQWYTTLLESMVNIGKDVYNLRRFLLGQEPDLAGDPECFETNTSAAEKMARADIHVSPNPSRNTILITQDQSLKYTELFIFDLSGQMMLKSNMYSSELRLDITNLPPGIYFLRFIGADASANYRHLRRGYIAAWSQKRYLAEIPG